MNDSLSINNAAESDENLPLPLVVAKKWNFQLRYIVKDGIYWYSIRDWMGALTEAIDPKHAWQGARLAPEMEPVLKELIKVKLPGTKGGSPSSMIHDKGLYMIVTNLRAAKNRPALAEIKEYLARAGAFVDLMRRDPEAAEIALALKRREKYQAQGKALEWIAMRELGIVTRKQLMSMVQHMLGTNEHMATLTNDTYQGVFGMTAQDLRNHLGIPQSAVIRDHFSTMALVYTQAAEEACRLKLSKYDDDDIVEIEDVRAVVVTLARMIGKQVKDLSQMLGIDILTNEPLLGTGLTREDYAEEFRKASLPKSRRNPFSSAD